MEQSPHSLLPVALVAAAQCVKSAVRDAADRAVDAFASAVLSSRGSYDRGRLSAAQFLLTRNLPAMLAEFDARLDNCLREDLREPRAQATEPNTSSQSGWDSLSLVDETETDRRLVAERIGSDIAYAAQEELSRFDAYVGSLLRLPAPELARNPLRPAVVARSLIHAVEKCGTDADAQEAIRVRMVAHLTHTLRRAYAQAADELERSGVAPLVVVLRPPERQTGHVPLATSVESTLNAPPGSLNSRHSGFAEERPPSRLDSFSTVRGTPVASVIRGLVAQVAASAVAEQVTSGQDDNATQPAALDNVIQAHRESLRQASSGATDHLIIDVVSILFDQILEDPRLPERMARHIARLQLPVLRTALDDASFFSSRRHPVRRFVNRLASLGAGMDELSPDNENRLLTMVGELVRDIVDGDFERMATYEAKLKALEDFVTDQARQEVQEQAGAATLVADREHGLRQQQLYSVHLKRALLGIETPSFLGDFICQVWSQVMLDAIRQGGEQGERSQHARECARELLLSVQPKGEKEQRKRFLTGLPSLMRALNEGIALVRWPDTAKADFFGKLLPAHAESLRGEALSTLDFNLLVKRIDAALATPAPRLEAIPLSTLTDMNAAGPTDVVTHVFSDEEAQRIGLLNEHAVDWQAEVESPVGEEAPVVLGDLIVQGLPEPEAPEPVSGAGLVDHLQVGFAYRMHLQAGWEKVRLNYVSPARSFFVFTHGRGQRQTVSMTLRMVRRLAEAGRLRAFEHAYLLERATARARRQLAELSAGAAR